MARHPRLILSDVAVHVVQRGNNRSACFRADGDYLTYLALLRHLSSKYACAVHAYCLMTNHVHLLLTPTEQQACGYLMRDLGRCYVRYFNRRHERSGTLWEGRFRSCMAESARYVLACYRYIELNPVRAGMVAEPGAYLWSSYAGNSGLRSDTLLRAHSEYLALSDRQDGRCAEYRRLLGLGLEKSLLDSIREATQGGYPLVSDAYKLRLAGYRIERGKPGPRVETPAACYKNYDPDPELRLMKSRTTGKTISRQRRPEKMP
jgi:putative transposase